MVKLDKIYTTGGDKGRTSLGNGKRVKKTNKIIIAVGSVEELNAHIGLALTIPKNKYTKILTNIQNAIIWTISPINTINISINDYKSNLTNTLHNIKTNHLNLHVKEPLINSNSYQLIGVYSFMWRPSYSETSSAGLRKITQ